MKKWIFLVILIAALIGAYRLMDAMQTTPERVELPEPNPPSLAKPKNATLTPGRIVELNTNKGKIAFVLFEKDCPLTTGAIAELVRSGSYGGVKFDSVEPGRLIQTAHAKRPGPPIKPELVNGLVNAKGAVGVAQRSDLSSLYISMEPVPDRNRDYAVIGRVIKGMDVVMRIKKGDVIKSAKLRPSTASDLALFTQKLEIESQRKTQ